MGICISISYFCPTFKCPLSNVGTVVRMHLCILHVFMHILNTDYVKGVQCYELFGGIALKNHTFSFFIQ